MGRKGSELRVAAPLMEYLSSSKIPVHTHRERPFEDDLALHLQDHVERVGATPQAGATAALRTAHLFEADDLRGLLLEFAYAWNLNGLGTVNFESDAGCDLRITRCWSCYGPGPGCGFVGEYLRTLLETKMGLAYEVTEVACGAEGDEDCRFAIRVPEIVDTY